MITGRGKVYKFFRHIYKKKYPPGGDYSILYIGAITSNHPYKKEAVYHLRFRRPLRLSILLN